MRELFPSVRAGERITGINWPGVGAEFWVNGRRAGAVNDPDFARSMSMLEAGREAGI